MRRTVRCLAFAVLGLLCVPMSRANETTQQTAALIGSMAKYAQPVRVGDLAGRYVLKPEYEQEVLGHVAPSAVVQSPDGMLFLLVDWGGLLGFGSTRVVVPLQDTALLGEHVVFVRLPIPKLAALRRFDHDALVPLSPDRQIRMMIVGPYH